MHHLIILPAFRQNPRLPPRLLEYGLGLVDETSAEKVKEMEKENEKEQEQEQ